MTLSLRPAVPSDCVLAFALLSLAGCSSTMQDYAPSSQVQAAFASARGRGAQPMSVGSVALVGDATDDDESVNCRGANAIKAKNGRFSQYFRQALTDELVAAKLYDGSSPVVVNVAIDKLDVSATFGTHLETSARFDIGLPKLSNTQLVQQDFGWRPLPWWACGVAAEAFPALVEKALLGFANSTEIVKATKPHPTPPPTAPASATPATSAPPAASATPPPAPTKKK